MRRTIGGLLVATFACTFLAAEAQAVVLVDYQYNGTGGGYYSDVGSQQIAETFNVSQSATATSLTFYGGFSATTPGSGTFDVLFYGDDGSSMPELTPFFTMSTSTLVGVAAGGNSYAFTTAVSNALFATAGDYWVSVRGTSSSGVFDFYWSWSSELTDQNVVYRLDDTAEWREANAGNDRDTQALHMEGRFNAIPEPASLLLLGLLLGGAGLVRCRRKVV